VKSRFERCFVLQLLVSMLVWPTVCLSMGSIALSTHGDMFPPCPGFARFSLIMQLLSSLYMAVLMHVYPKKEACLYLVKPRPISQCPLNVNMFKFQNEILRKPTQVCWFKKWWFTNIRNLKPAHIHYQTGHT
jgi:hypothetical protein